MLAVLPSGAGEPVPPTLAACPHSPYRPLTLLHCISSVSLPLGSEMHQDCVARRSS